MSVKTKEDNATCDAIWGATESAAYYATKSCTLQDIQYTVVYATNYVAEITKSTTWHCIQDVLKKAMIDVL
jgi:hypothetical protein